MSTETCRICGRKLTIWNRSLGSNLNLCGSCGSNQEKVTEYAVQKVLGDNRLTDFWRLTWRVWRADRLSDIQLANEPGDYVLMGPLRCCALGGWEAAKPFGEFLRCCPDVKASAVLDFLEQHPPLDGEFLISSYQNGASSPPDFVLTNRRFLVRNRDKGVLDLIDLSTIKSVVELRGFPSVTIKLVMTTGKEIIYSKLRFRMLQDHLKAALQLPSAPVPQLSDIPAHTPPQTPQPMSRQTDDKVIRRSLADEPETALEFIFALPAFESELKCALRQNYALETWQRWRTLLSQRNPDWERLVRIVESWIRSGKRLTIGIVAVVVASLCLTIAMLVFSLNIASDNLVVRLCFLCVMLIDVLSIPLILGSISEWRLWAGWVNFLREKDELPRNLALAAPSPITIMHLLDITEEDIGLGSASRTTFKFKTTALQLGPRVRGIGEQDFQINIQCPYCGREIRILAAQDSFAWCHSPLRAIALVLGEWIMGLFWFLFTTALYAPIALGFLAVPLLITQASMRPPIAVAVYASAVLIVFIIRCLTPVRKQLSKRVRGTSVLVKIGATSAGHTDDAIVCRLSRLTIKDDKVHAFHSSGGFDTIEGDFNGAYSRIGFSDPPSGAYAL